MTEVVRCFGWGDALNTAYHDEEWGRPVRDERGVYERLCLEGFQSGLSWLTILRKREAFRRAFASFDPDVVAGFTEDDIERLLADDSIVRHRGKIEAAIGNARAALELEAGPGFSRFLWSFVDGTPKQNRYRSMADIPSQTPESHAFATALKEHGFRFCGPTTMHAFMQSVGMVNDHLLSCHRHKACAKLGVAISL